MYNNPATVARVVFGDFSTSKSFSSHSRQGGLVSYSVANKEDERGAEEACIRLVGNPAPPSPHPGPSKARQSLG